MSSKINNIRFDDLAWIHFNKSFISFGHKNLPENIHFTLAFNTESPDINFHISKNIPGATRKPKIEIFRISKLNLEKLTPYILDALIKSFFKPFNMKRFIRKSKKVKRQFIPIEHFREGNPSIEIENILTTKLKSISKKNGQKRLKLNGILQKMEEFSSSNEMINFVDQGTYRVTYRSIKSSEGGLFRINRKVKYLIQIHEKWFEVTLNNLNVRELVNTLIGSENDGNHLIQYFCESLNLVKEASSFDETLHWNRSAIIDVHIKG
jgi:hypothetical protein